MDSIEKSIAIINRMISDGIIRNYVLGGVQGFVDVKGDWADDVGLRAADWRRWRLCGKFNQP